MHRALAATLLLSVFEPSFCMAYSSRPRICQAFLSGDSKEDSLCQDLNTLLNSIRDEKWNMEICSNAPSINIYGQNFEKSENGSAMETKQGSVLCFWEFNKTEK